MRRCPRRPSLRRTGAGNGSSLNPHDLSSFPFSRDLGGTDRWIYGSLPISRLERYRSSRYCATVSVAMVRSGRLRQRLLFDQRVAVRRTPLLEKENPHRCFVKGLSAHRGKRKKSIPLLPTSRLLRTGGLAARPVPCCIIVGCGTRTYQGRQDERACGSDCRRRSDWPNASRRVGVGRRRHSHRRTPP
jgi:hypothetical protein